MSDVSDADEYINDLKTEIERLNKANSDMADEYRAARQEIERLGAEVKRMEPVVEAPRELLPAAAGGCVQEG